MTAERGPVAVEVGNRLRRARRNRFGSLNEMERQTGVAAVRVGSYERGDRGLLVTTLVELAELYQVPAATLLPMTRRPPDEEPPDLPQALRDLAADIEARRSVAPAGPTQ